MLRYWKQIIQKSKKPPIKIDHNLISNQALVLKSLETESEAKLNSLLQIQRYVALSSICYVLRKKITQIFLFGVNRLKPDNMANESKDLEIIRQQIEEYTTKNKEIKQKSSIGEIVDNSKKKPLEINVEQAEEKKTVNPPISLATDITSVGSNQPFSQISMPINLNHTIAEAGEDLEFTNLGENIDNNNEEENIEEDTDGMAYLVSAEKKNEQLLYQLEQIEKEKSDQLSYLDRQKVVRLPYNEINSK